MKRFQVILLGVAVAASTAACGTSNTGGSGSASQVTWHQDIAPLVTSKCVGCHRDGGIAPFSMQRWENASQYSAAMVQKTSDGTMPPFLAEDTADCVPRYGWKDDLRLSAAEKALIKAWNDQGALEGDPAHAAKLPEPVDLTLPDPDLHLTIPSPVDIDGNRDQFWCYVLPTGLTEDHWYDAMQITAGNAKVVHHVLVFNDESHALDPARAQAGKYECFGGVGVNGASLVNAWAPGGIPLHTPPNVAIPLKANATLILQVHYHPTGIKETDGSTGVDFRLASGTPTYSSSTQLIGNFVSPTIAGGLLPGPDDPPGEVEFKIPAGVKHHTETMTSIVSSSDDMLIYGMGTHMHYAGQSMVVHLKRGAPKDGEPEQECLIDTPKWNFNWQRGYQFDAPLEDVPVARAGDHFLFQCDYNNSLDNPFMEAALTQQSLVAPRDIYLGETTLDEMCLGAFAVATKIAPAK